MSKTTPTDSNTICQKLPKFLELFGEEISNIQSTQKTNRKIAENQVKVDILKNEKDEQSESSFVGDIQKKDDVDVDIQQDLKRLKKADDGVDLLSQPEAARVKSNNDESFGRWTPEEHQLFLEGIMLYGKDWKKIQALVKTRTLVQIRTHAQKLFKKINQNKTSLNYEHSLTSRRIEMRRSVGVPISHDDVDTNNSMDEEDYMVQDILKGNHGAFLDTLSDVSNNVKDSELNQSSFGNPSSLASSSTSKKNELPDEFQSVAADNSSKNFLGDITRQSDKPSPERLEAMSPLLGNILGRRSFGGKNNTEENLFLSSTSGLNSYNAHIKSELNHQKNLQVNSTSNPSSLNAPERNVFPNLLNQNYANGGMSLNFDRGRHSRIQRLSNTSNSSSIGFGLNLPSNLDPITIRTLVLQAQEAYNAAVLTQQQLVLQYSQQQLMIQNQHQHIQEQLMNPDLDTANRSTLNQQLQRLTTSAIAWQQHYQQQMIPLQQILRYRHSTLIYYLHVAGVDFSAGLGGSSIFGASGPLQLDAANGYPSNLPFYSGSF